MEDLENNNWIILDPLGIIYKIYANMTVMTLLNCNHLLITQAELCLKGTFVKGIFFCVYEDPTRKCFIKSPCPKHPRIINWNKKLLNSLFSHFFVVPQKALIFLSQVSKRSVKIQTLCHFFCLFEIWMTRIKTVFPSKSHGTPNCHFHSLNSRDI